MSYKHTVIADKKKQLSYIYEWDGFEKYATCTLLIAGKEMEKMNVALDTFSAITGIAVTKPEKATEIKYYALCMGYIKEHTIPSNSLRIRAITDDDIDIQTCQGVLEIFPRKKELIYIIFENRQKDYIDACTQTVREAQAALDRAEAKLRKFKEDPESIIKKN